MIEVVVVISEDCNLCEGARDVLGRVGEVYPLRVREVPLSTAEGRRLALDCGAPFPPVILLDGELFSYGRLSERKLLKAMVSRPAA